MPYKHPLDTSLIVGKNWKLQFNLRESSGGHDKDGYSTNFTCASAVMWNINFLSLSSGASAYSHDGPSPVPIEERYELYQKLVDRYVDNTFMVQLVGVVNGGTAARLKHYLQSENKHGYHTYDFVNFLIAKEIGVVVESPVFLNTYHGWEGPSICQAWFWFSPSILAQGALVEGTGGIHGLQNVKKYLHDSDLNKTGLADFNDLLAAPLVTQPRFANAAGIWNNAMKSKGIAPRFKEAASEVPSPWKKKSA